MENYKKTFYSKKFSNDFNFAIIQGKKAHWFIFTIFFHFIAFLDWNYFSALNDFLTIFDLTKITSFKLDLWE